MRTFKRRFERWNEAHKEAARERGRAAAEARLRAHADEVARQRAIAEARRRQAAHEAELSAKYPGWDYYAIQQYEALRGRVEREQEAAERQRPVAYIRAELKNDGDLRWRIFARDSYTCQQCGAAGGKAELTIDHITPVSRGGTNAETNLQTLCRSCNSRKGARV